VIKIKLENNVDRKGSRMTCGNTTHGIARYYEISHTTTKLDSNTVELDGRGS
jgi:hypothetical protein